MARCVIQEEDVTLQILAWLKENKWEIVCYDFPQSGTGYVLKPNGSKSKNKGCITPDIVAVNIQSQVCIFFENKNRYFYKDFVKQNSLITDNQYSQSINKLLENYPVRTIFYGIGMPADKYTKAAIEQSHLVDFVVGVYSQNTTPKVLYSTSREIFGFDGSLYELNS